MKVRDNWAVALVALGLGLMVPWLGFLGWGLYKAVGWLWS